MQYTWKYIKQPYKNTKFKISSPTWNEELELTDGSYYVSDIQDYIDSIRFWIYSKNHGEETDNPSIIVYVNKIQNTIMFKIRTGYYLEFLTSETMKLLGSNKGKVTKDKDGENGPNLEVIETLLVHCNIVMIINKIQESCIRWFLMNRFSVTRYFS